MSEKVELFSGGTENFIGLNFQDIESDSLRQRSALSGNNDISFFDIESGRGMARNVFMSFLETLIFLHVVEIISSDNYGVGHLGGNNHTPKKLIMI